MDQSYSERYKALKANQSSRIVYIMRFKRRWGVLLFSNRKILKSSALEGLLLHFVFFQVDYIWSVPLTTRPWPVTQWSSRWVTRAALHPGPHRSPWRLPSTQSMSTILCSLAPRPVPSASVRTQALVRLTYNIDEIKGKFHGICRNPKRTRQKCIPSNQDFCACFVLFCI